MPDDKDQATGTIRQWNINQALFAGSMYLLSLTLQRGHLYVDPHLLSPVVESTIQWFLKSPAPGLKLLQLAWDCFLVQH